MTVDQEELPMHEQWVAPGTQPGPDPAQGAGTPGPQGPAGPPAGTQVPPPGVGPRPGPLRRELTARTGLFPLRPFGLGEMLGAAVGIYRRRPRLVFGLTALVMGIAYVVITLVSGLSLLPTMSGLQAIVQAPEGAAVPDTDMTAQELIGTVVGSLLTGLITLVAAQLVIVVLTRITLVEGTGERTGDRELRGTLRRRGPAAVGAGLLTALITAAGFVVPSLLGGLLFLSSSIPFWVQFLLALCGILVGVLLALYLWARASLTTPALVVEEIGPLAAIRRSFVLTRGRRLWRILGSMLLLMVLYTLAQQVLAGVFGMIGTVVYAVILVASDLALFVPAMAVLLLMTMLGTYVASVALTPFLAAGTTCLYLDARMRHEAFDITLRARAANASAPTAPTPPQPGGPSSGPGRPDAPWSGPGQAHP
jgi:hypothetical protein